MTKLSIRWRLTLWYCVTLAIALGAFCFLILVLARHQALTHLDSVLQEELEERVLEVHLARSMPELVLRLRERFFEREGINFHVLDDRGEPVFASAGLVGNSAPFPEYRASPISSPKFATLRMKSIGDYRVASKATQNVFGDFLIQTIVPLQPTYAEIHSLQTIMLILLPLALAVASIGGYVLAGRALAPAMHIANVANSITIDRLDQRIEIVNPNDEIGHLAAVLNSLIARLENAVNEIQRFTADASHELRTPLAALRTEAESALRSQLSVEEYEKTLNVIVDEATRLGKLTDQLLHLSRLDAGTMQRTHDSVRLDALLLDVAEQLKTLAEQRQITIVIRDLPACEIQGDDIRLSQAFFNVIENAIKYSAAAGEVAIGCQVVDHAALIEVRDTGPGIPPEQLQSVFDRFYRGDSSRDCTIGGTGLGLSIARAAVHAHGGTIEICSQLGAGSTLKISLPNVTLVEEEQED